MIPEDEATSQFLEALSVCIDAAQRHLLPGQEQAAAKARLIEAGMWFGRGREMYQSMEVDSNIRTPMDQMLSPNE